MDVDLRGRVVVRYSTYDGSWIETHGLTSPNGGRHYEVYNCQLTNTSDMDLSGRWSWLRAGVAIITDNYIDNTPDGFAAPEMKCVVEEGSATNASYPYYKEDPGMSNERCYQAGWGFEGGAAYRLGAWYWDNTGPNGSLASFDADAQEDREIFVDQAPSDNETYGFSYTKYTYPHPLRGEVSDSSSSKGNASVINLLIRP